MRRFPPSLRGLTIAFLAIFLATTVVAGLGIFSATRYTIDRLVDRRIQSASFEIADDDEPPTREDMVRRIRQMMARRETADLGLLLTDADGRRIVGNTRFSDVPPLGFSSLDDEDRIEGLSEGRVFVRAVGRMRLAVFGETEPIDNYFALRWRIYVAGFGAIVIVVLSGLLAFRRMVALRIGEMRQTAESIIEGDLSRRVPLSGDGGEFDQQGAAFNRMLDRIAQLMEEIRSVSNDISHEMRTPLARLRNQLSLLEERTGASPVRAEVECARQQVDQLLEMFGAMLRIAEIDSGSRRAGFEALDLGQLAEEIVQVLRPLANEQGQRIVSTHIESAPLRGDRQLLLQLLLNLMENALRHTPQGATVRIAVERTKGAVIATVEDDGPGIPADQRTLVMRRFGRLDRSDGEAGHGLGLPLVAAIARLHRGTIRLEDAEPGLRTVVTLPD